MDGELEQLEQQSPMLAKHKSGAGVKKLAGVTKKSTAIDSFQPKAREAGVRKSSRARLLVEKALESSIEESVSEDDPYVRKSKKTRTTGSARKLWKH